MNYFDLPNEIKMYIRKFVGNPTADMIKIYFKNLNMIAGIKRTIRLEIYMMAEELLYGIVLKIKD